MKNKIVFVTVVFALCMTSITFAKDKIKVRETEDKSKVEEFENKSFQFRGVEWNIPMEELIQQVVSIEVENGLDKDGYTVTADKFIIYDTSVGGHACEADYFILDDKFVDGGYFLKEKHTNIEKYYSDYTDLIEKYTEKYGKPLYNTKEWIGDSLYKDNPDKYGMAVAKGDLILSARWEAEDGSAIEFSMTGDNFDISTRIDYLCPNFYNDASADEGI